MHNKRMTKAIMEVLTQSALARFYMSLGDEDRAKRAKMLAQGFALVVGNIDYERGLFIEHPVIIENGLQIMYQMGQDNSRFSEQMTNGNSRVDGYLKY